MSFAGNQSWIPEFKIWLVRFRDVSHDEFLSKNFQLAFWNTEVVAATGTGRINISEVAEDSASSERLWQLKQMEAQTRDPAENDMLIADSWTQIASAVAGLTTRNPRFKICRISRYFVQALSRR